jgi:SAM-dependent methyltransferase
MKSLFSSFMEANRRACQRLEALLPAGFRVNLHRRYEAIVSTQINMTPNPVVVDVGAGKHCPYLRFISRDLDPYVIGIDNSEYEIRQNRDISASLVSDVTASLPFANNSVDIITSRSVLEHLKDTSAFFGQCHEVLVDGGIMIHSCPCRFSPFSLINQLLPNAFAKSLIRIFHPAWANECGFLAYYDNCWESRLSAVLNRHGFEIVGQEFRYYQAIYFDFFLPAYALMLAYDLLIYALGIKNLACQMIMVARKHPMPTGPSRSRSPGLPTPTARRGDGRRPIPVADDAIR